MFTKFSQFNNGGGILPGDLLTGLRGGINTVFNAPTLPIFNWQIITAPQVLEPENGYMMFIAAPTIFTLPAICGFGSIIQIMNLGPSTFTIAQNAGQQIGFGDLTTTVGIGGSIACTADGDGLTLICTVTNVAFQLLGGPQGNWVIT